MATREQLEDLATGLVNESIWVEIEVEKPQTAADGGTASDLAELRARSIAAGNRVAMIYRREDTEAGRGWIAQHGLSHDEAVFLLNAGARWVGLDEQNPIVGSPWRRLGHGVYVEGDTLSVRNAPNAPRWFDYTLDPDEYLNLSDPNEGERVRVAFGLVNAALTDGTPMAPRRRK